jgi:hypothetical protein
MYYMHLPQVQGSESAPAIKTTSRPVKGKIIKANGSRFVSKSYLRDTTPGGTTLVYDTLNQGMATTQHEMAKLRDNMSSMASTIHLLQQHIDMLTLQNEEQASKNEEEVVTQILEERSRLKKVNAISKAEIQRLQEENRRLRQTIEEMDVSIPSTLSKIQEEGRVPNQLKLLELQSVLNVWAMKQAAVISGEANLERADIESAKAQEEKADEESKRADPSEDKDAQNASKADRKARALRHVESCRQVREMAKQEEQAVGTKFASLLRGSALQFTREMCGQLNDHDACYNDLVQELGSKVKVQEGTKIWFEGEPATVKKVSEMGLLSVEFASGRIPKGQVDPADTRLHTILDSIVSDVDTLTKRVNERQAANAGGAKAVPGAYYKGGAWEKVERSEKELAELQAAEAGARPGAGPGGLLRRMPLAQPLSIAEQSLSLPSKELLNPSSVESLLELYADAQEVKDFHLNPLISRIASKPLLEAKGRVLPATFRGVKEVMEEVWASGATNGTGYASVCDLCHGGIVFDSLVDVHFAMKVLEADLDVVIEEVDNRFDPRRGGEVNAESGGYRELLFRIRFPKSNSQHICTLRFHLHSFWAVDGMGTRSSTRLQGEAVRSLKLFSPEVAVHKGVLQPELVQRMGMGLLREVECDDSGGMYEGDIKVMAMAFSSADCVLRNLSLVRCQLSDSSFLELATRNGCLLSLDLTGNNLQELPGNISMFVALEKLVLSDNQLAKLPAEMAEMQSLQYLMVDHNQLEELPEEMKEMWSLKGINIAHNQLRKIPPLLALHKVRLQCTVSMLGNRIPPAAINAWKTTRRQRLKGGKIKD